VVSDVKGVPDPLESRPLGRTIGARCPRGRNSRYYTSSSAGDQGGASTQNLLSESLDR